MTDRGKILPGRLTGANAQQQRRLKKLFVLPEQWVYCDRRKSMSVEVLLIDQVDGLGIEGDIVKVADGYARNYLFPNGYATLVTEGKRRQIEKKRAARLIEIQEAKVDAEILSKKIAEIVLQISVKVGENGKMFGSVGIPQLTEHLAAKGIELERSMFKLHQPISKLGEHEIKVVLHPEVNTNLKLKIVQE